ncbi:MAG: cupredoxin domain-containing protein, partial [Coriobacteriia bacterium]|nr:cupredoxin domain-containing protein [Coriobacteriia bacterium]
SAPAEKPQAAAALADGVQRIDVDVSAGYYDPTIIELVAGVPAVITFSQGSGCLAEVQFPDLGIAKDLTHGGAVIELPALQAGEYGFNCGMEMVFGTLLVQ